MVGSDIRAVQIVFLLLLTFVVAFAALARRLQTPYPIVLVIGGLLLSFIPRLPRIDLDPNLVFFVILPPLLYAAAWTVSWREFQYNLVSISSLAIGLVGFTVAGIALASRWLFPGLDWRAGWVLGAVVAPTDAVAATSIGRRLGLPGRVIDLLEGESLVNDATALLALQFATALMVRGDTPTVSEALLRMVYLIVGGIVVGLLVGYVVVWIERWIDDAPLEIAISILVPYAGYLAADAIHASGVLAVVACGLYLSRRSWQFFSPNVRLQAWAVWDSLTFVLNGLVFVLLGLQLPHVLAGIQRAGLGELILYGLLFSALVIVLRLLWIAPGAHLSFFIRRKLLHQRERVPDARQLFVVGWTGMRGVVSLAAALSLPQLLADGRPFPGRNLIIFLTFSVILVTLVLQGITLPPLIRALGLAGSADAPCEEQEARRLVAQAAFDELMELRKEEDPGLVPIHDDVQQHYAQRLAALSRSGGNGDTTGGEYAYSLDLSRRLLAAERRTAVQLRNQGRINDEVLRRIEHELDLADTQMERIQTDVVQRLR